MSALFLKMLRINNKGMIMSISQLILTGLLTTLVFTQPIQAAGVKWLTLVSLTFDDGKNESNARSILASHGMHGTFYINTNRIGIGNGFLTRAELDALYADGNEIGGHTIGHVDLATLSDTDQKTAICEDMSVLVDWGYDVHSFAYPFSSRGLSTESIVEQGCPGIGRYESARAVGGLRTATSCTNCPTAESLIPGNSRYISTPPSVKTSTTLADLKSYVTQAEANGGGWVPLVFHNICDGCSNLAVSPDILHDFLTWLEARTAQGTHVRTVHQVISGDYPGTTPTPTVGANLLQNPSLESDNDADNQPDCWLRNEYGNNQANWIRSTDAHTGNFSEQLTVTSYTSGDSKLVITPDAGQSQGGCSPTVDAGSTYQLSVWYKSTTVVVPELFYLDASNVWQYWRRGTQMPASDNWNQMVFYPGTLPVGAKAINFGMSLQSVGTLITDDYSIVKVENN
ncbi:MAG: polysaccharide deacetylase family protein [Methylococcales bacterium]|nr:polysaccharide deacetylase family protein [Methylococcales bacterium]